MRRLAAIGFFAAAAARGGTFPDFKEIAINAEAGTGLAIAADDIDGDGKIDIIGVSDKDANWYRNPTWEKKPISGTLKGSNVCVAATDLDGDKLPEIAIGADWQFNNTESGGALYVLRRKGSLDEAWEARQILAEEPTLHRIRWMKLGEGKAGLVVAPLKGRGTTAPAHAERGARLFMLHPPRDFMKDVWKEELIDESLHLTHNIDIGHGGPHSFHAASVEGITQFNRRPDGQWLKKPILESAGPRGPVTGCGEVRATSEPSGAKLFGTIEPFHGNRAVVYLDPPPAASKVEGYERHVVDENLAQGHAVQFADFNADGVPDMLVGFREPAGPGKRTGLNIYALRFEGEERILAWEKHVIDDGGMACEDAVVADFTGDGRPDIAAFGRATRNIKLYENLGAKP